MSAYNVKKVYKKVNNTFLFLDIFVLTYPLWVLILRNIIPQVTKCTYRAMTGRMCPFCGSTTLIRDFLNGNVTGNYSISSLIILVYLILSLIFRLLCIALDYKFIKTMITFDIILNVTFAIYIVITIAKFVMANMQVF